MRTAKAARVEIDHDDIEVVSSETHSDGATNNRNANHNKFSEMESLRSICAVTGARANFFSPRHLERFLSSWSKDEDSSVYKTVFEALNVFAVPLEQYWNNSRCGSNAIDGDSSDERDNDDDQFSINEKRKENQRNCKLDTTTTTTATTSSVYLENVAEDSHTVAVREEKEEASFEHNQEKQRQKQKSEESYRQSAQIHHDEIESIGCDKSLLQKKLHFRIPHARFLSETFYPSRVDAMLSRGYRTYNFNTNNISRSISSSNNNNNKNTSSSTINSSYYYEKTGGRSKNTHANDLIIAIDRKFGNGDKMFNIFTRGNALSRYKNNKRPHELTESSEQSHPLQNCRLNTEPLKGTCSHSKSEEPCWSNPLATFIDAIPNAYERNLYVVVDENTPVDSFFDIDCHLPLNAANRQTTPSLSDDESIITLFCREVLLEWFSKNDDASDDIDEVSNTDSINGDKDKNGEIANSTENFNKNVGNNSTDIDMEKYAGNSSYATWLMWKVEQLLLIILRYLRDNFEKSLKVKLKQCLVLTSSVAVCKRTENGVTKSSWTKSENSNNGNKNNVANATDDKNKRTSASKFKRATRNHSEQSSDLGVTDDQTMNNDELVDLKISFHVHFRFANNWVFSNIQELHQFMMKVRTQLDESILLYCHKLESAKVDELKKNDDDDDDDDEMQQRAEAAALVRTCVDFGVYTRWRAFRLPYNVKCPLQTCNTYSPCYSSSFSSFAADAALANRNAQTLGLLSVELAEQELYNCTGLTPPSHDIGAIAPNCLSYIVLPTSTPTNKLEAENNCEPLSFNCQTTFDEQFDVLRRAMYCFRFLVPLDPYTSTFTNNKLRVFMEAYAVTQPLFDKKSATCPFSVDKGANDSNSQNSSLTPEQQLYYSAFVDAVFDMACIQREITDSNADDNDSNKYCLRRIRIPKRLAPISEFNKKEEELAEEEQKQNESKEQQQEEWEEECEQSLELEKATNSVSNIEDEEEKLNYELESNGAIRKNSVGRSPFSLERPPLPHSSRVLVYDREIRSLVAEVFMCLSPLYGYHGQYNDELEQVMTHYNHQHNRIDSCNNNDIGNSHRSGMEVKYVQMQPTDFDDFNSVHLESISPERLTVQYEEAIRAYYVYQKQSRYCLQLNRLHRATYGQLYLTYGSIKVRCYSNDCCARCLVVPWNDPNKKYAEVEENNAVKDKSDVINVNADDDHTMHNKNSNNTTQTDNADGRESQSERISSGANSFVSPIRGYPKYDRLIAIRSALFPPLPADELLKRYGMSTLRAV